LTRGSRALARCWNRWLSVTISAQAFTSRDYESTLEEGGLDKNVTNEPKIAERVAGAQEEEYCVVTANPGVATGLDKPENEPNVLRELTPRVRALQPRLTLLS
jgi:hypothetical protein